MIANLAITGLGAMTPVGLSPLQGMHSIRSGITRLALQRIPDRVRQWVAGGNVPCWTPYVQGRQLEALARMVTEQAWRYRTSAGAAPGRIAVIAVAPERVRPGFGLARSKTQAAAFFDRLGMPSLVLREVVEGGPCGAHLALQRAVDVLSSGGADACFIVAADSQLQIRVTRWHEDNSRLKCSYVNDGLMPAEAAACMIVETVAAATARGAPVIARIASVATTHEPAGILSDLPNTATGLTDAVRHAISDAHVEVADLSMVWSDLNGESYKAREWAFTELRMGWPQAAVLLHPADCHGDLGGACDTSLFAMAAMAVATGWSKTKPVLVFCGSESGARGASVVLPAPPSPASFMRVSQGSARVYSTAFALPQAPAPTGADSNDPLRAAFVRSLREEHRDELVGLYYQRKALLSQPAMPWPRLAIVEQRILSHLDAVATGGVLAIAAVTDGLASDDEGEAWAATLLVGTLAHPANLDRVATQALTAAPGALVGLEAALCLAPDSTELEAGLREWLADDRLPLKKLALGVAAARGTIGRHEVIASVRSADPGVAAAACRVVMHTTWIEASAALQSVLFASQDGAVRRAAMEALIAIEPSLARSCAQAIASSPSGALGSLGLAIMGDRLDTTGLADAATRGSLDQTGVQALGIAGHPACVHLLLQLVHSNDDSVRAASARALALVSGIPWAGALPVTDAIDPDADLSELAPATALDVAIDSAPWERWWRDAPAHSSAAARWRLGRAFDPAGCIDEIAHASSVRGDRERAHLELLSRSREVIRLNATGWVAEQERAIARWRRWWQQHPPGR